MEEYKIVRMVLGPVQTNCYILANEKAGKALVVDPAENAGKILDTVLDLGCQLTDILLTHGHFDHIGAVDELRDVTGATVYAMAQEEALLKDPSLNLSSGQYPQLSIKADRWLSDYEEIEAAGYSVLTLYTPGHTSGGCCYYLPQYGFLFSGDTLFDHSVGRTDFPTGDSAMLVSSIRDKLLTLPGETHVLPGHGAITSIAVEQKENMFL